MVKMYDFHYRIYVPDEVTAKDISAAVETMILQKNWSPVASKVEEQVSSEDQKAKEKR